MFFILKNVLFVSLFNFFHLWKFVSIVFLTRTLLKRLISLSEQLFSCIRLLYDVCMLFTKSDDKLALTAFIQLLGLGKEAKVTVKQSPIAMLTVCLRKVPVSR